MENQQKKTNYKSASGNKNKFSSGNNNGKKTSFKSNNSSGKKNQFSSNNSSGKKYQSTSNNITNEKVEKPKPIEICTDWFYMTPNEVTAKMIADLMKLQSNVAVDLWEEMNVLQLELNNKSTIDIEPINYQFKDPSDLSFIKNRNIKTIFWVTIEDGDIEPLKPILQVLFDQWDGFLCADSNDFKPLYTKDDVNQV